MSFAQTGSGARFIAVWQVHSSSLEVQLSQHYPGLIPIDELTVTDDRGPGTSSTSAPAGT